MMSHSPSVDFIQTIKKNGTSALCCYAKVKARYESTNQSEGRKLIIALIDKSLQSAIPNKVSKALLSNHTH